jgi:hypothetical protein
MKFMPRSLLASLLTLAGISAVPAQVSSEELIEVYDRENNPLRTAAIELSPNVVENSVEKALINVRVKLTGSAKADGEVVVRQVGGNEFGAFYGRLIPYKAGQSTIDLECHINPVKGRHGIVIVQAMITSSFKAQQGSVTTELKITGGTTATDSNSRTR